MSLITCSSCGGSVYEYGPSSRGMEKAVKVLTGCTAFSCYWCGRRGWLRNGRSDLWAAILAKSVQILLPLLIVIVVAFVLFGVLMR